MKWAIPALLLVGACATAPAPKIITRDVNIPVSTACVPHDLPAKPTHYADEAITDATPDDQFVILTAKANQERKKRLAQVEPVIAGCS